MTLVAWLQPLAYLAALTLIARPLGRWIADVLAGADTLLTRPLRPLERALMWVCGVDSRAESGWLHYAQSLLLFNLAGALFLYGVLRLQPWLPLSFGRGSVAPDLAFNTAISFATNTSWQAYAGEQVLGHAAQMLGLTSQCFLSCATGIATLAALTRGFARHSASNVGNFWADVIRVTVHVLLPLAVVVSGLLVAQGAVQTLESSREWHTLEATTWTQPVVDADGHAITDAAGHGITESKTSDVQTVWLGPVASQTAIELLSGDGGGFYNANSSHPWANPTPLSNFVSMLAILLLPCALCFTFGHMVGDMRQGWALYAVMAMVLAAMAVLAISAEQGGNPALQALVAGSQHDPLQGDNLEGKETRFGAAGSALFATVTTAGGDGAVNSMHDSYTPLGGLVPTVLMQLGEVIFGGPGSGLFGMLLYAITAVFVAGLMIGRAPEYLGKRIEAFEMKMISLAILVPPGLVLAGTAVALLTDAGRAGIANPGAHGFSEILYAYSSTANNNGSAFAGLSVNTPFYNVTTAIAMWFGRFVPIVAVLAIAGSLAAKKRRPDSAGTLPTHGGLFIALLLGTVFLIGALTYVPALALGPVIEHIQMTARK
jgi:K+-transporting ATPase ATPase A chain